MAKQILKTFKILNLGSYLSLKKKRQTVHIPERKTGNNISYFIKNSTKT